MGAPHPRDTTSTGHHVHGDATSTGTTRPRGRHIHRIPYPRDIMSMGTPHPWDTMSTGVPHPQGHQVHGTPHPWDTTSMGAPRPRGCHIRRTPCPRGHLVHGDTSSTGLLIHGDTMSMGHLVPWGHLVHGDTTSTGTPRPRVCGLELEHVFSGAAVLPSAGLVSARHMLLFSSVSGEAAWPALLADTAEDC